MKLAAITWPCRQPTPAGAADADPGNALGKLIRGHHPQAVAAEVERYAGAPSMSAAARMAVPVMTPRRALT